MGCCYLLLPSQELQQWGDRVRGTGSHLSLILKWSYVYFLSLLNLSYCHYTSCDLPDSMSCPRSGYQMSAPEKDAVYTFVLFRHLCFSSLLNKVVYWSENHLLLGTSELAILYWYFNLYFPDLPSPFMELHIWNPKLLFLCSFSAATAWTFYLLYLWLPVVLDIFWAYRGEKIKIKSLIAVDW